MYLEEVGVVGGGRGEAVDVLRLEERRVLVLLHDAARGRHQLNNIKEEMN